LRNLVSLRDVRIKIVLAVEFGFEVQFTIQSKPCQLDELDRFAVRHGQGSGLRRANRTNVHVRFSLKPHPVLAITKHLGLGLELNMDFHSNDWYVFGHMCFLMLTNFNANQYCQMLPCPYWFSPIHLPPKSPVFLFFEKAPGQSSDLFLSCNLLFPD